MTIKERGELGHLKKGKRKIDLRQWCIHDDDSLTLITRDEKGFNKASTALNDIGRKRNNPDAILVESEGNIWQITNGTEIALLRPVPKGEETPSQLTSSKKRQGTLDEDIKCDTEVGWILAIKIDKKSAQEIIQMVERTTRSG
ncbi:MAG: hypothetical protein ABR985_14355 [Methanotrichaceae archaeon]|jgi:hypothetical protein